MNCNHMSPDYTFALDLVKMHGAEIACLIMGAIIGRIIGIMLSKGEI